MPWCYRCGLHDVVARFASGPNLWEYLTQGDSAVPITIPHLRLVQQIWCCFPGGFTALKRVITQVGSDLRGASLPLDSGIASMHNRNCIFNASLTLKRTEKFPRPHQTRAPGRILCRYTYCENPCRVDLCVGGQMQVVVTTLCVSPVREELTLCGDGGHGAKRGSRWHCGAFCPMAAVRQRGLPPLLRLA
jgi:hypothetical protein